MNAEASKAERGHGWFPYILPYFAFVFMAEFGGRLPESAQLPLLYAKALIPIAFMGYFFFARDAYPELRAHRPRLAQLPADLLFGALSGVVWMLPYVLIPSVRPDDAGFDPMLAGEGAVALVLSLRMLSYAVTTPLFEEIFIRSFVMRYAEVWPDRGDFRDVPLAQYSLKSFWVTVVVFTLGHVLWEYPVCVAWVIATNWWFYRRRNLWSLVAVHSAANATILLAAVFLSGRVADPAGDGMLSLWFFV